MSGFFFLSGKAVLCTFQQPASCRKTDNPSHLRRFKLVLACNIAVSYPLKALQSSKEESKRAMKIFSQGSRHKKGDKLCLSQGSRVHHLLPTLAVVREFGRLFLYQGDERFFHDSLRFPRPQRVETNQHMKVEKDPLDNEAYKILC